MTPKAEQMMIASDNLTVEKRVLEKQLEEKQISQGLFDKRMKEKIDAYNKRLSEILSWEGD